MVKYTFRSLFLRGDLSALATFESFAQQQNFGALFATSLKNVELELLPNLMLFWTSHKKIVFCEGCIPKFQVSAWTLWKVEQKNLVCCRQGRDTAFGCKTLRGVACSIACRPAMIETSLSPALVGHDIMLQGACYLLRLFTVTLVWMFS